MKRISQHRSNMVLYGAESSFHRAKLGKDEQRESFEEFFSRIDVEGMAAVTWDAFLGSLSSERSLAGDGALHPPIMCLHPAVCKASITLCKAKASQGCPAIKPDTLVSKLVHPCGMGSLCGCPSVPCLPLRTASVQY